MEWLDRLNDAVGYIEEHLDGEISYDRAAELACCSTYHFQRMFSYIADVPLSEYIRRRRMTCAAFDLQNGGRVIDAALKYGYDSPTSFNRAFQSVHGMSPKAAGKAGVFLKAYPRISFKVTIKGDTEMNYKIEEKEAFKIVGMKKHYEASIEECFEQVPLFWQEFFMSGKIKDLCALITKPPFGILGVSTCSDSRNFDYYIAAATDKETPQGLEEYTVPACTWAVFECIGAMPQSIQTLQKRIVTEWLPTSGYEYADAPDIEVYSDGDQQSPDYRCEVWMPVCKKA